MISQVINIINVMSFKSLKSKATGPWPWSHPPSSWPLHSSAAPRAFAAAPATPLAALPAAEPPCALATCSRRSRAIGGSPP